MKRFTVLFLFVCVTSGFSQGILGHENKGLHAVFAVAPVSFPFEGGESKLLSSAPMAGVGYTLNLGLDVTFATFLSGDLNVKNGDKENWNLNLVFAVIGWKGGVAGIGYNFANEGHGIRGIKKESLSFVLGFNFKTI